MLSFAFATVGRRKGFRVGNIDFSQRGRTSSLVTSMSRQCLREFCKLSLGCNLVIPRITGKLILGIILHNASSWVGRGVGVETWSSSIRAHTRSCPCE